jgi:hypothetical protein
MLQEMLTPKRGSAARGHGIAYRSDGTAYNTYKGENNDVSEGAFTDKAADSLARISTPEISQWKSEDFDNEMAEAWVANASEFEMDWGEDPEAPINPDTGKRQERVKFKTENEDYVPKTDPKKIARAQQIQNRLQNVAMYNQGDSDLGRKVQGIWERIGRDPRELKFGSARDPNNPNAPVGGTNTPAPPSGGEGEGEGR